MKHLLKRFVGMVLCVMALVSLTTTVAFATEIKDAPVNIHITDETGSFNGTLKVDFYNAKNSELVKSLELTKANSWGNDEGHKFELSTAYTYSLMFSGLDGVEIIDTMNRTAISTFQPQPLTNDLYWSLIAKKEAVDTNGNVTQQSDATALDRENVTVKDEEAEAVYEKFLEEVSFIADDETWYNKTGTNYHAMLEQYNETLSNGKPALNSKTYSSWFEKYVQDGTAEKFFELSKFERFLWTETYTRFAAKIHEDLNMNYADEASFRRNVMKVPIQLMNGNNKEAVIAAYEELAMWQYGYIKEHGYPFCFISNRSYMEEVQTVNPTTEPSDTTPSEKDEVQDVIDNELTEEEKAEVQKEDKGVWGDTLDILANNALTILIIVVLLVVVGIVYYIKSRKNVDDN